MSAPTIRFFSGKSELYAKNGRKWSRLSIEDEARGWTGLDAITREHQLGIAVTKRSNGLFSIDFDLIRLGTKLKPETIERLKSRWEGDADSFSKSLQKSVNRRVHFSRSFCAFEVSGERLAEWESQLRAILEDGASYEHMEHQSHDKQS